MPAWMRTLTTVRPARAGATGAALAVVNPKVLFICAAADWRSAPTRWMPRAQSCLAALFVAVAASSVAIPVLAYAVAGDRLDAPLERLKNWMDRHNAALVAAILIVIGLLVLYKGIRHL